jgi:putative transposase
MERYRITSEAAVYYLTYSIVDWLPVFIDQSTCRIITDSLTFCHRQKSLRINAFVIMPTHLHLIAFDVDFNSQRLSETLTDFRKFTGRKLCDYCERHLPECFRQTLREEAIGDRARRFWQPSRHPVVITTEEFWNVKRDYLHDNPCRKGLVHSPKDWRFSSAAWYDSGGVMTSEIPLTAIDW